MRLFLLKCFPGHTHTHTCPDMDYVAVHLIIKKKEGRKKERGERERRKNRDRKK